MAFKSPAIPAEENTPTQDLVADRLSMLAEVAGDGLQDVTVADLIIPRIGILQALSPEVDQSDSKWIEGASPGMIADITLGDLLGPSVMVVPAGTYKEYVEWQPDRANRAPVAFHGADAMEATTFEERGQRKAFWLPNGNMLTETIYMFCLNLDRGLRPSNIFFSRTQLRKGKNWVTRIASTQMTTKDGFMVKAPFYSRAYKLSSVKEEGGGNKWNGWKIDPGPMITEHRAFDDIMATAKELRKNVALGRAKADRDNFRTDLEPSNGEKEVF